MPFAARPTRGSWTPIGRLIVLLLASSSICCLLADFYALVSMRAFTLVVFIPSMIVLAMLAVINRTLDDRGLARHVLIGLLAGLMAAAAYDLFRVPFVFAQRCGISWLVPQLDLFKVMPMFGAMIQGEAAQQLSYSTAAHLLGWLYHFSNGATFGIMYIALIGDGRCRHWLWAVLFSVALELGMLLTPYPATFGIDVTPRLVAVTLAAHVVFGLVLGLLVKWLSRRGPGGA